MIIYFEVLVVYLKSIKQNEYLDLLNLFLNESYKFILKEDDFEEFIESNINIAKN